MNSLFVNPPIVDPRDYLTEGDVQKIASNRLTSAPSYWPDEITQILLRDHPYIPQERVVVNFKRQDPTRGYAIGYIGVSGAPQVSIPVVVSNRELKPMDVLVLRSNSDVDSEEATGDMTDDQVLPLTEETFNRALDVGDVGDPMPESEIRGTGWSEDGSSLRLPFRGRTVLASYLGASEAQKERLGEILSQDKAAGAGFLLHGTQEIVEAWLNAPDPQFGVARKLAHAPVQRATAEFLDEIPVEMKTAEFLAAPIFVERGQAKLAVSFETVDLANPVKGLERWLLFEDGSYCQAPEKVAVAGGGDHDQDAMTAQVLSKIATNSLQRGSVVSFLVDDQLTAPASLATIGTNEKTGTIHLQMVNSLGQKYPVVLAHGIKTAMLDEKTATWILPINTAVLRLGSYANEVPMPLEKVASFLRSQLPDQLVCAGGQFTLSVGGEPFAIEQVGEAKAAAILDHWFENGAELFERVKQAAAASYDGAGMIRFRSDLRERADEIVKQAEIFQNYPEIARAALDEIALPLDKAVKLAAAIGSHEGADAVLSAGMLTEDNLSEFVSLADQFEETVGKLARLLLAVRLGFPGDENATVVAMKSLQRVSERLQSAVQEVAA